MRLLYSALTYVLRPFALAVIVWRGLRDRLYWRTLGERFGRVPPFDRPSIWVHAVSLGEVTAAAPLVRALLARYPQMPFVLTTATATGRARAQALFGAAVSVCFLPYDTSGAMRRFMVRVRPQAVIIMETELWPNLFHQCRRRGVPVLLASARLSPTSVARYRRFGGLFRDVWSGNTRVAAQTVEDAERFLTLGADPARTTVIGNVKFDVTVDASVVTQGHELRSAFWEGRPVWIAGSTHAGEEEAALAAHAELQAEVNGALLLLVPRHPERFQAVADVLNRRGVRYERRSSGNAVCTDTQVLLVDTVGELARLYAAVDVAFVGGSLVPVGGHNLLEPAALGLPVLTGPYQANGKEIARLLLRQGAAIQVDDARQLADALKQLLLDPERRREMGVTGLHVLEMNRGSVARLMALAEPLIDR
jgi:3-deoxy-D-manno-octulosonic-acid transferase